ncbi:DsbA family protein [Alloacidobacterium sp.]|uniref:DsbA family protein n=1 Tax=Alloacidobacterium sp. TaxID=2951999 RepID=UPI002D4B5A3C|nr:thioredoxin domain-containing protein [Alloacidobacterium sp.]HYK36081.1 thioredoxin domain-containing protein [Alloacidobacterium sp.]
MAILLAAGCKAQDTPLSPKVDRRIEILVRSQLNVPQDWNVTVGPRTKSDIAGFDTVPITFSSSADPTKRQTLNFLLSKDGNTLARLSKWDISKDPADLISTDSRPVRGNPQAKVTIISFDDLECPYCARMHAQLFPDTLDRYKNEIKVVYKDYPLIDIHPWALHAAVNANCLAAQSPTAYWNYVDYLHTHGDDISGPKRDAAASAATLDKLARDEGQRSKLDSAKLDACLAKQDDSVVRASIKEGDALGVDGTPTLFINGERLSGALPESQVWLAIDRALKAEGVTPPQEPTSGAAAKPGGR